MALLRSAAGDHLAFRIAEAVVQRGLGPTQIVRGVLQHQRARAEYGSQIRYPPFAIRDRVVLWILTFLDISLMIVVLATPAWIISGNRALGVAVFSRASLSQEADIGDTVRMGVIGIEACGRRAIMDRFCHVSLGAFDWESLGPWTNQISGGAAMWILGFVSSVIGLILNSSMSWPTTCKACEANIDDPWRLRWALGLSILFPISIVFKGIGLLLFAVALPPKFVGSFSSLVNRSDMTVGPAIICAAVSMAVSCSIAACATMYRSKMFAYDRTYDWPPRPQFGTAAPMQNKTDIPQDRTTGHGGAINGSGALPAGAIVLVPNQAAPGTFYVASGPGSTQPYPSRPTPRLAVLGPAMGTAQYQYAPSSRSLGNFAADPSNVNPLRNSQVLPYSTEPGRAFTVAAAGPISEDPRCEPSSLRQGPTYISTFAAPAPPSGRPGSYRQYRTAV